MLDPLSQSTRCIWFLITHVLNISQNFTCIQLDMWTIKKLDMQDLSAGVLLTLIQESILAVVSHRPLVKHNYIETPPISISTCLLMVSNFRHNYSASTKCHIPWLQWTEKASNVNIINYRGGLIIKSNHLTHLGVNMLAVGIWIVNVPFLCTYCLSFREMLATCCYLKYLPFFRSLSHFFRYSECSSMHIPTIGTNVSEPHTSVFNYDFSWFPSALPWGFEWGIYYDFSWLPSTLPQGFEWGIYSRNVHAYVRVCHAQ